MELIKMWEIMIRRRRSIMIVFLSFFLLVVALTVLMPRTYESTAIILVRESGGADKVMLDLGIAQSDQSFAFDADTEVAMGLIDSIMETVIDQMELVDRNDKTMTVRKLVKGGILNSFSPQPHIEVEQIEESSMLEISGTSGDPDQASDLANLMADLYLKKRIEIKEEDLETALNYVNERMGTVQQDYDDALYAMRDFLAEKGAIDIDIESKNLLVKIAELETQLETERLSEAMVTEEQVSIDKYLASITLKRGTDASHPDIGQINSLKSDLNNLLQDTAALRVGSTEASSDYRKLIAKIDLVQERITSETDAILAVRGENLSVFGDLTKRQVDNTISLAVVKAKIEVIERILAEYQKKFHEVAEKITRERKLQEELSLKENTYLDFTDAKSHLGLAQGITPTSFVLVQQAKPSDRPIIPVPIVNYILGIILGGVWAFGFAFLKEYTDDSIQSPADLANRLSIPILGLLPEEPPLEKIITGARGVEGSSNLERLRTVHNRLMETQDDSGLLPRSLLVTSVSSGEGKSYLTAFLAAMFANYGLRVIAVDMNLRKPVLDKYFGESNSKGLGDFFSGEMLLEEIIVPTEVGRLDILPAGKPSNSPMTSNASLQLQDLIEQLQRSYDVVLIDSPAIRDYEDAVSISPMVEAIVLVIAAGRARAPRVKEVIDRLQLAGRRIAGVVVNRVDPLQYRIYR